MLAEYLGSHGYATAGLAANVYCSYDTGLDRGFTHYEDYVLEKLGFLRTAVLIDEALKTLHAFDAYIAASPLSSLRGVRAVVLHGSAQGCRIDQSGVS